MTRKEFNQCRGLYFEVRDLEEMIEVEQRVYYPKIPILTGMPAPTQTDRDGQVIKLMEYVEQLNRAKEELLALRQRAEEAIEFLDDPDTRRIMRMFYLRGMRWKDISNEMNLDRSVCFKRRNKALEQLKYF